MKFLAIDTSGKHMSVVAYRDGETQTVFLPECAMKHSIALMGQIDEVCKRSHMNVNECDFFAVVTGPGSFTGIRIGISTVKGLCFACGKPALAVTSFDCLAYAEKSVPVLALVDAGHGNFYACGYDEEKRIVFSPAFLTGTSFPEALVPAASEPLFEGCRVADPCAGLIAAVLAKGGETVPAEELTALYLRKSSAEEKRA